MTQGENITKVTLLKRTQEQNDFGEMVDTWAADTANFASGKLWGEWWDQGGRETLETGQIVATKDIRFKPNDFITGLNEADYRIERDSKEYDIESIKVRGRSQQELMLKGRDNA